MTAVRVAPKAPRLRTQGCGWLEELNNDVRAIACLSTCRCGRASMTTASRLDGLSIGGFYDRSSGAGS